MVRLPTSAKTKVIPKRISRDPSTDHALLRLASLLMEITQNETTTDPPHKDKKVIAVTPQPEFIPFFDLQYEPELKLHTCSATPGGFGSPNTSVTLGSSYI